MVMAELPLFCTTEIQGDFNLRIFQRLLLSSNCIYFQGPYKEGLSTPAGKLQYGSKQANYIQQMLEMLAILPWQQLKETWQKFSMASQVNLITFFRTEVIFKYWYFKGLETASVKFKDLRTSSNPERKKIW